MSTRRQKVDDMDVSASSDLWNEPVCDRPESSKQNSSCNLWELGSDALTLCRLQVTGPVDDAVVINAQWQPSSPSM